MKLVSKADLDEVQLAELDARFARLDWFRPAFLIATAASMLLILAGDHAEWRAWIVAAVAAGAMFRGLADLLRPGPTHRMRELTRRSTVPVITLSSAAFFVATGGLDSPFLPVVIMLCFFFGTTQPRRRLMSTTLALAAVVVAMAVVSWSGIIHDLMPVAFGGGPRLPQPAALLWVRMALLLVGIAWSALVSSAVRDAFREIVGDALDARDEVLRGHEAHSRELTTLSGELAHELKNPLANVKGLAALVRRDVQGKGVERLEVLQHEIGRMEEVLQEFLTFSRPLSPLSQEEVDLDDLCRSVARLHEGMAHGRVVRLEVSAQAPVRAYCDPRKVRQILINLVQNAMDASPPGSAVQLVVLRDAGGSRVEVRDRGPGIAAVMRNHLFEPGATTKERGTGLGLALARGLARQHGGDVVLTDRDGGGCAAILTLPARTARPAGEAA